jgi:hypothetical protein
MFNALPLNVLPDHAHAHTSFSNGFQEANFIFIPHLNSLIAPPVPTSHLENFEAI